MTCPDCKGTDTRVIDTLKSSAINTRRLRCQSCGVSWQTDETIRKGSIQGRSTPIRTPSLATRPPPLASATPSVAAEGDGGVGGGVSSGSDLSLFPGSDLLFGRITNPDQTRARKKRRDAEYTSPQFVAFWALYPRKVAKKAASAMWWQMNLDAIGDEVTAGLLVQVPVFATREPDKVPHAATWLYNKRWTDDPEAYRVPAGPQGGSRSQARIEPPRCEPHKSGRLKPWEAPGPAVGLDPACTNCAEIKHRQAQRGARDGEPEPVASLFGGRR